MKHSYPLPLLCIALLTCCSDGVDRAAAVIDEDLLRKDVTILAGDRMEGRAPGSYGDKLARKYLARRLGDMGYTAAARGGVWEQPFDIVGILSNMPEEYASWARKKDWDQDLDMPRIAAMARRHQPGLLVVDRWVAGPFEDYLTPEQKKAMMVDGAQPHCDEPIEAAMICSHPGSTSGALLGAVSGLPVGQPKTSSLPNPVLIAVGPTTVYAFKYKPRGFKVKELSPVRRILL